MKTTNLRLFSAFSGYDSVLMALLRLCVVYKWLKVKLVGWCDIDPYAIACHNVNFPEHSNRNYGDISKIDWDSVEDFDLFSTTSPCQDYSYAGKRMGGAEGSGTRSALLWECEKAIAKKRPKFVLFENVKPLMDVNNEDTFINWQQRISNYGYVHYSQVLDAAWYGIPQHRERTFMISIRIDDEYLEPSYGFPNRIDLRRTIEEYLDSQVDEKYYLSKAKCDVLMKLLKSSVGDVIETSIVQNDETSNIVAGGKMKEQYITPVCKDNVLPTLTAQGAHGSPRAMFSTGTRPCPGVVEIWTKNKEGYENKKRNCKSPQREHQQTCK